MKKKMLSELTTGVFMFGMVKQKMKNVRTISLFVGLIMAIIQLSFTSSSFASPVAYWNFEEGDGTTLNDVTGNGHTGTIHGAIWTPGQYGTGLFFDGSNDYVLIPDSSDLNPSTEITVEFWVNIPSDINHWGGIIEKGHNNGTSYCFTVKPDPYVDVNTAWPPSPAPPNVYSYDINTDFNNWHHIAFTLENGLASSYFDGNLVDQQSGKIMSTQPGSLLFGLNDGGGNEYGRFWLDEVRIYNHALTEEEIRRDMEAVPLPPAIFLLGTGLVSLAGIRFKRKK